MGEGHAQLRSGSESDVERGLAENFNATGGRYGPVRSGGAVEGEELNDFVMNSRRGLNQIGARGLQADHPTGLIDHQSDSAELTCGLGCMCEETEM